jgi:hypothetical protein
MTMHSVTTCPTTGYVVTLHGVNYCNTDIQQCKCTFQFYYIYVISIHMSNVITVSILELIIYAAFDLSWIKHKNADFGFIITY